MRIKKTIPLRRLLPASLLLLLGQLVLSSESFAQMPHPVCWSFFSRQISPGIYEVHTIITVQEGWRFHHQTPVEVAPLVGQFTFLQHPNVLVISKLKSERTVATITDKTAPGDTSRYYESSIRLTHLVRLKQPLPTNLAGEIFYTICHEQQHRLLQDNASFSILLR